MMTSAQVAESSVNATSNSPSRDYAHPDDHNLPNYDVTPRFKPFTVIMSIIKQMNRPRLVNFVTLRAFFLAVENASVHI